MTGLAAAVGQSQSKSIQEQQQSIRRQYGGNIASVTSEQPNSNFETSAVLPVKPVEKMELGSTLNTPSPNAVTLTTVDGRSSFFTNDWPEPAAFSMPNVRLPTIACDALGEQDIHKLVTEAATKHNVKPELVRAVIRQESGFRPCAVSTAGAMGLMQIMPETADTLGLTDPFDPGSNVEAGTKFLKQLLDRYNGDVSLALGAYNAGPARVDKAGGVPPIAETMDYVSRIVSQLPGF